MPADSVKAYAAWLDGIRRTRRGAGRGERADARARGWSGEREHEGVPAGRGGGQSAGGGDDSHPKCMVPIGGRPLLDIWLDAFGRAGVGEVLINLHHLPEVVSRHLAARAEPPSVRMVFEPVLLGSACTLAREPASGWTVKNWSWRATRTT